VRRRKREKRLFEWWPLAIALSLFQTCQRAKARVHLSVSFLVHTQWLFRNTPELFVHRSPITQANHGARVDFPHEFLMGKMNDAPLDHNRDLVVLSNAASDLPPVQGDVPP
jgi:hypothetical protein